jgi:hypothetical protein
MRSPLWNLMVRAAQDETVVVMRIAGMGPEPFAGTPTLPVAANHVVMKDGTVVSLSAVSTARLRGKPVPDDDEEPF